MSRRIRAADGRFKVPGITSVKQRIIDASHVRPALSFADIAALVGCTLNYVYEINARLNLDIPRSRRSPGVAFSAYWHIVELGRAARDAGLTIEDLKAMKRREAA